MAAGRVARNRNSDQSKINRHDNREDGNRGDKGAGLDLIAEPFNVDRAGPVREPGKADGGAHDNER